ncbi:transglutaminase family protein [Candidatus Peregrinibacteria bacterium]|jgi:hypothetical protein|nr:transglutaminase family protein [Candidatus Peregrinibacteria bacterium]MBT7483481.1 transglutaminase family protein [Candidatus Peregrinibacteria bacterium]MBT7703123.1 transglutaminase family protein [Candidatus Peregrinibacteria bacterium]
MNRFSLPECSDNDDSCEIINNQIEHRLEQLSVRIINPEGREKPPHYAYRLEEVPLTFEAVATRAWGIGDKNLNWKEGIEDELGDLTIKVNVEHVEEDLEATGIYRNRDNFLAVNITEGERLSYARFPNLTAYINGEDETVQKLATVLTQRCDSNEEKAAVLLAFVQSLKYHPDDDKRANFLQPPSFTLAYGGGACDDLTILYASLLESVDINYRVIISNMPSTEEGGGTVRHATVAVQGDFEGFYRKKQADSWGPFPDRPDKTVIDGVTYFYAEPAAKNNLIGQKIEGQRPWFVLNGDEPTTQELEDRYRKKMRES